SDGQLLFLQHMISKMRDDEAGSRIGIVMNGSPLFTGGAGSGESEIRRWMLEKDWVERFVQFEAMNFLMDTILRQCDRLDNTVRHCSEEKHRKPTQMTENHK